MKTFIISLLITIFFVLTAHSATTFYPTEPVYSMYGVSHASPAAACSYGATTYYGGAVTVTSVNSNSCTYLVTANNQSLTDAFTISVGCTPPKVLTTDNTQCVLVSPDCVSPQVLDPATNTCVTPAITCTPPLIPNGDNTACITDCSALNGQLTGSLFSTTDATTYCYNGCNVTVNNSVCVTSGCAFDGKYTNTSCTATNSSPPSTPEQECLKKGLSYGTINDQVVCVQSGTTGAPPITTTNTGTTITSNGSTNSTTTTTTNYNPVTNTVTTTSTTVSNGGAPTTQTTEQDKLTFCQENPEATICSNGSFSGSCANGFSCDGDASTCAIARHQHQARCKDSQDLQSEFSAQIAEGMDILNGQLSDDAQKVLSRDASITTTIDVSNDITEAGALSFGSQCFDDLTVTVLGTSLVIPISSLCTYLEMMGYILLALAYVSAFRIIGIF